MVLRRNTKQYTLSDNKLKIDQKVLSKIEEVGNFNKN